MAQYAPPQIPTMNKLRTSDPAYIRSSISASLAYLSMCRVTESKSNLAIQANRTSEVFCLRVAPCAVHADVPRGET